MTLKDGITSIGNYSFCGCNLLKSITIPDSVISIGEGAFQYCSSLISFVIPDGVTSIGCYTFQYCESLISVTIGSGITSIEGFDDFDCAFAYCVKLVEVYNLSSLDITAGSTDNGYAAYYAKNVYTAAGGASKLIHKDDYVFYNDDGTYYLLSYTGTDTDITLPDNINGKSYDIYGFAFYYCTKLTNVTIPDSITHIENDTFFDCVSLTSVIIPNGVTYIGFNAFSYCISLESVTIPDSVTYIGYYAFGECTALTSVTFENTSGWYHSGSAFSSGELSDTSTAARYLILTYSDYSWYRSED